MYTERLKNAKSFLISKFTGKEAEGNHGPSQPSDYERKQEARRARMFAVQDILTLILRLQANSNKLIATNTGLLSSPAGLRE